MYPQCHCLKQGEHWRSLKTSHEAITVKETTSTEMVTEKKALRAPSKEGLGLCWQTGSCGSDSTKAWPLHCPWATIAA